MSATDNAAVVRRFWEEVWNRGNLAAVEEFVDQDFTNFGVRRGVEGMRHIVAVWRTAFPDFRFTVEDEIVQGDKVVHRMTARGTHTGEFRHPAMGVLQPTGRSFAVDQTHIHRLAGGKIVEHWATRNDLAMLQQLGVLSTPAPATDAARRQPLAHEPPRS